MSQEENLPPGYDGATNFVVKERYFTPKEAAELLPDVVAVLEKVRATVRTGRDLLAEEQSHEGALSPGAGARLSALQDEINKMLGQIRARGVEVKGLEPALLDFPALRYGQEVYLCWKDGEETIDFWHPLHTGVRGRQPLDETELGAWEWCN